MTLTHAVCARICLVWAEKLLLVSNRVGSFWYPPGGHCEVGESLEACARRELFEETGIARIILEDVLYVSEFLDRSLGSHKVECLFRARLQENDFMFSDDWKDLGEDCSVTLRRWFCHSEMADLDIRPRYLLEGAWLSGGGRRYQGFEF